jgi:hypothetical protein
MAFLSLQVVILGAQESPAQKEAIDKILNSWEGPNKPNRETIAKVFKAWEGQPHRLDSELISDFLAHQTEFESLIAMIQSDRLITRIDDTWTLPSDLNSIGVTDARLAEYRNLFKRLGIFRGFSADPKREEIRLLVSCQGMVARGSCKSFVYFKNPPKKVVTNLDVFSKDDGTDGSWYRHIQGPWYLEFNRN